MRKGELTRQRIIAQAAPIFNQRGFAGCSMQDLMEATGLEKGGLYRHFSGKEELAAEEPVDEAGVVSPEVAGAVEAEEPAPELVETNSQAPRAQAAEAGRVTPARSVVKTDERLRPEAMAGELDRRCRSLELLDEPSP